jgi:hypothetical protein
MLEGTPCNGAGRPKGRSSPATLQMMATFEEMASAHAPKWTFTVFATNANSAGVAPVDILTRTAAGMTITNTATVRDDVVFRAQFRTDHNVAAPVSGTLQIIVSGTVIR